MPDEPQFDNLPPISELSKQQRRVLGVLVEKAFTTPEYYPLTLKAVTTGCNQKSNRAPITDYDEDTVADALEELRQLGLAAVVHTESGRAERYRHYMRRRFTLTEPQLAVLTELLLRGRQQLGELRSRASRMVPIENQEQLRDELHGLQQMNLLQASGPLDRRGVEVDHNLYRAKEGQALARSVEFNSRDEAPAETPPPTRSAGAPSRDSQAQPSPQRSVPEGGDLSARLAAVESANEQLRQEAEDLRTTVDVLRDELRTVTDRVDQLCRELGSV